MFGYEYLFLSSYGKWMESISFQVRERGSFIWPDEMQKKANEPSSKGCLLPASQPAVAECGSVCRSVVKYNCRQPLSWREQQEGHISINASDKSSLTASRSYSFKMKRVDLKEVALGLRLNGTV